MDRRTFLGTLGATAALAVGQPGIASDPDERGELMPAFFIGHGSPLNAVEENRFTIGWRRAMQDVPQPRAILCVSAHWPTPGTLVTSTPRPRTLHDHGIDSRELRAVRYPAPGSPDLATLIAQEIQSTFVGLNDRRGLDHAAWSILRHAFPNADIPVVQLSLDVRQPGIWHYRLGQELRHLRRRGVLIIGSGNIVHNVSETDVGLGYEAFDWSIEADEVVKAKIRAGDHSALCDYHSLGKSVSLAVPTPEHYYPLLYVLGTQMPDDKATIFNDALAYGCVTMTSVRLGVHPVHL